MTNFFINVVEELGTFLLVGGYEVSDAHSIWKYTSSHTRSPDISKDDWDLRERWEGKGRVADKYNDVDLPYVDATAAALLYMRDPCKYSIIDK